MPKPKKRSRSKEAWWQSPRLGGLLLLALAVYLVLALGGAVPSWWSSLHGGATPDIVSQDNPGGPVGSLFAFVLRTVFGLLFCWAVPALMAWRGARSLFGLAGGGGALFARLAPLWLAFSAWIGQPVWPLPEPEAARWGGAAGFWLARGFHSLFGRWGGFIFLSFLLITALILVLRPWLPPLLRRIEPPLAAVGKAGLWLLRLPLRLLAGIWNLWRDVLADIASWLAKDGGNEAAAARRVHPAAVAKSHAAAADAAGSTAAPLPPRKVHLSAAEGAAAAAAPVVAGDASEMEVKAVRGRGGSAVRTAERSSGPEDFPEAKHGVAGPAAEIPLPSVEMLREPAPDTSEFTAESLHAAADLLEDTLRSFGVQGKVVDVRPGPVVTTYEYQPASGVRVSAIVQRSDDLALAMKARSIRMEAPIPGKAAVGIEIPNPVAQTVTLREVFTRAGDRMNKPLSVVLGRDVFGEPVVIDLAGQPHLLVAGATGSGKSVCVNAMISTLLLRCDPSIVRLMLIDPKMLELNVYNDIPHLLLPVVTDPKEALRALKWMEAQMDHRYRRLSRHSVRNIEAYNEKVAAGSLVDRNGEIISEPMPYYLCIVDELADLMVQLGQEIEMPITRLAQKARAVGIHLILATQRPSVDVLTGVIKANIPCRIAFRVIQRNDSRTILDANGAEQLLGRGDMLYLQPGRALPVRVHGAFIDIDECEAISEHWRRYKDVCSHVSLGEEKPESGITEIESDPLFDQAKRIIVYSQHGSTSMLQRKMGVGYARAGRLMDLLENAGVVGPFIGSKAREVLMSTDDLEAEAAAVEEDEE